MIPRSAAERGPGTATGRALLEIAGTEGQPTGVIRDAILAIEAEAAASAPTAADAWQAGYEACWNRLKDAGRLLPSTPAAEPLHPRTYSLTASGPNGELFLVTDDESGINIGHAKVIGGPLTAPPSFPPAEPMDVKRLVLHSDDDDCQPPHVHRHHWVDVLYPGDKVWFYCTGCEERRIKPAAEDARLASADEEGGT